MSGVERRVAREALRDLMALTEDQARLSAVMNWLRGEEAHQRRGLWVCEEIFSQSAEGGFDGRSLLTSALSALLTLERPQRVKLMALARDQRLELARATLLASLLPARASADQRDSAHLTSADGRSLTLGERRSLARAPSAKSIERLLLDPDLVVLQHLLQNPRLTELLVLRIATHRPQLPQTLLSIFSHPKWGTREQVRNALALNPSTPLPIRCALVYHLSEDDLEALGREPNLSALLNAALRRAQRRISSP